MRPTVTTPDLAAAPSPNPRIRRRPTMASFLGNAILSRGLRYGLLAIYAGTIYVLVVALGGYDLVPLTPPWWLNLIALLIIAATFLPVHGWLRSGIDRLIYDWHDNPYAVLSEVRQHLDYEQDQTP
jgi:hypothetical protein